MTNSNPNKWPNPAVKETDAQKSAMLTALTHATPTPTLLRVIQIVLIIKMICDLSFSVLKFQSPDCRHNNFDYWIIDFFYSGAVLRSKITNWTLNFIKIAVWIIAFLATIYMHFFWSCLLCKLCVSVTLFKFELRTTIIFEW